ncbi:MAG: RodZ domain-containing protein [Magnetovibrionaceae bacterium]
MKRASDKKTTEPAANQQGVGALLRATRLRHGLDLEDVASILRIRSVYIEAIEGGRYADLPGSTYAVGFIRSYSEHLGLDAEEIIRRFKAEAESLKDASLAFPEPIPETGIPSGAILLTAVLFAGLAYGAWMVATSDDNILSDLIQPVPEELAANGEETSQTPPSVTTTATGATAGTEEATATEAVEPEVTPPGDGTAGEAPAEETVEEAASAAEAPEPESEQADTEAPSETVASGETASDETAPDQASATQAASDQDAEQPSPTSEQTETQEVVEQQEEPAAGEEPSSAEAASEPTVEETAPAEQQEAGLADPSEPEPAEEVSASEPSEPASEETQVETAASPTETTAEAEGEVEVAEAAPQDSTPQVRGEVNGPSRISLLADQATWMEIRDAASNDILFSGILSEGQTYRVPDRGGIEMVTGNAGGLTISVDGDTIPPIGPPGAVRRGVKLEPTALLQR